MKSAFCDICGMTIKKQIVYNDEDNQPVGIAQLMWSEEKARALSSDAKKEDITKIYPILEYFYIGRGKDICHECLVQASKGFAYWVKARREEVAEVKIWSKDNKDSGDYQCWK